jgi:hypothetical protein
MWIFNKIFNQKSILLSKFPQSTIILKQCSIMHTLNESIKLFLLISKSMLFDYNTTSQMMKQINFELLQSLRLWFSCEMMIESFPLIVSFLIFCKQIQYILYLIVCQWLQCLSIGFVFFILRLICLEVFYECVL